MVKFRIAALFVEIYGPYFNSDIIDPWDVIRDARLYSGPFPVIAHPPCERWGRYWSGGPSAKVRRKLGDDNGCFKSALKSVREFGGLIEHPEGSHAFHDFFLPIPPKSGGWVGPDEWGGFSCCVEQGHYGHSARKATWLYAIGLKKLPKLKWGASTGIRLDEGFHSTAARKQARAQGIKPLERLSKRERIETPKLFLDLLTRIVLGIADGKKTKISKM